MKKYLIIGILLFSNLLSAQSKEDKLSNFLRINLGLHGAELSYELPISKKFAWENAFGIGMGSNIYTRSINYSFDLARPTPFLKSEFKYIYNRNKRILKNKLILNNSGNYIGLQTKYSFGNSKLLSQNKTLLTEIHWGIQRALGEKFIFNLHLGLGYLKDYDTKYGRTSPTFGLRFGYKLF